MSKLKSLEELFGGRHFDREIIILCVRWYLRYKLSPRDLVEMMAERGFVAGSHDDPALGEALYARVRQTLEPHCYACGSLVACRRDLPEDSRQVGLPIPGGGSGWPDGGLHAQGEA
jgi:hypothetical protein